MITEVILFDHEYMNLQKTVDSILADCGEQKVKLILLDTVTGGEKKEVVTSVLDQYPQIKWVALKKGASFLKQFEKAKTLLETKYVHFIHTGNAIGEHTFQSVISCMAANKENTPNIITLKLPLNGAKNKKGVRDERKLSLLKYPYDVPTEIEKLFFKSSFIKELKLTQEWEFFGDYELLIRAYEKEDVLSVTEEGEIIFREDHISNLTLYSNSSKREWYEEFFRFAYEMNMEKQYMQYMMFYVLRAIFLHNINSRDKHVFNEDYEYAIEKCKPIFEKIDDTIIANVNDYFPYRLDKKIQIYFFQIKYGNADCFNYLIDPLTTDAYLSVGNVIIGNISLEDVRIEAVHTTKDAFILECSNRVLSKWEDFKIKVRMEEKELKVEETYRYTHLKFFGHSVDRRKTFRVYVPFKMIKKRIPVMFFSEVMGYEHQLVLQARCFPAEEYTIADRAYRVVDNYILDFSVDKRRIYFAPYTKISHLKHEIKYLEVLKEINKDLYKLRLDYWKSYPKYHKKNIWITFDKLYKGGDCGEYFYKYVSTKQQEGVDVEYIITDGSKDQKRLREEGYKPLTFGSKEHMIKYMYAKVIALTHPNKAVYSGLKREHYWYFRDLINAKVVCIQHGLAVQQLALNCNQIYDDIERFYIASRNEYNNLIKPIYGYKDEQLKLTGIPRFDGLKNDDKKQILIAPTWRSYIAMPPSIGSARPYSPTFKGTDYFKIYQSLLENEELLKAARKGGYKILYLLHPTISSQIEDYKGNDVVEIISPTQASYETLLTQSSLMVTDYSGVQFDFAYMRKPIVYYHPDKLPPHYVEGGFFYDTMGFGEIVKEQDELVNLLIGYMENSCQMKKFYVDRADDFFAFKDDKSCERIYEDVKELLGEK